MMIGRIRPAHFIALLLGAGVIAIWADSYRNSASVYWARRGVRYELCSDRGELTAVRFTHWKRSDPFTYVSEGVLCASPQPISRSNASQPFGAGWNARSYSHLGGFESAAGSYEPPFSWQMPQANFRRVSIPLWFVVMLMVGSTASWRFVKSRLKKNAMLNAPHESA